MEKVRTNPANSKNPIDRSSNDITNDELEKLREKMSKKPSPVEGVDNIISYDISSTTLETIKLLVESSRECKKNLRATRERMRKIVESIAPDINLIEGLEDDLKKAITEMLEDPIAQEDPISVTTLEDDLTTELKTIKPIASEDKKPANTVAQQGGKKRYYIKYV